MKCRVVKLFSKNVVCLRPGAGRMDRTESMIHADTLFSALCNALLKLYDEGVLLQFAERVVLSSLFPGLRSEDGKDLLFLPRPVAPFSTSDTDLLRRKKEKKVSWFSWKAFAKVISRFNAKQLRFDCNLLNEEIFALEGRFALLSEEKEMLGALQGFGFLSGVEPHVAIDRVSNTAFEEGGFYFQENLVLTTGTENTTPFLYFLVHYERFEEVLQPALNLLVEEGIGGERHQGKGIFDRWESEEIELPDQGNYLALFSVALPNREETGNLIYYDLVLRRGFVYHGGPTAFYKKPIFKLVEGSIVRLPFAGCNIDVAPRDDYRVISYGKALGFAFS
ncbi:MAG: CRISPR-associated protein Csm4 [Candidatus Atribacteria bacterium]|nr:CRISPR-associated protein Csm4 [Candidatus Atribacteria bacterium]